LACNGIQPARAASDCTRGSGPGYIAPMALGRRQRVTTIILDATTDRLIGVAARAQGISRSEFIRGHLRRALEQYRSHPKPRPAGIVRGRLRVRGDESELG